MQDHLNSKSVSSPTKAISDVATRLELVIDEETKALRENNTEKLALFCERKNRILLEFNRVLQSIDDVSQKPGFHKEIGSLKSRLTENKAILKRQLLAVKEYAVFLESEARRGETDGTYSKSIGQFGLQK